MILSTESAIEHGIFSSKIEGIKTGQVSRELRVK